MGQPGGGGQAVTQAMPSTAQARIISAALELFAQNGVGGTSLQMIADAIGVTKAAVYHQYNTKDEIVLAAAQAELERVDAVVRAAEAESTPAQARKTLVTGMVDLAVAHRRTVSTVLNDPVIVRFFAEHESFRPSWTDESCPHGRRLGTRSTRLNGNADRCDQRYSHAPSRCRT